MIKMLARVSSGILLLLLCAAIQPSRAEEVWRLRFAPQRKARLSITDLKFASSSRGVAAGRLIEGRRSDPVTVITADGGKTWQISAVQEVAQSLFFVNETVGWMGTSNALWKTLDAGRTWTKLPETSGVRDVIQVYFLDPNRGWAVGRRKLMRRTDDGGMNWTPVAAAEESPGSAENTSFECITFVGGRFGMVAGASVPPQPPGKTKRGELPHLTIFLDTRDGGETWKPSTTSMFGRVTRAQFAPDGRGLGLIEFERDFDYPSEVFSIDWKTGKSVRAFRRRDCTVTDVALGPDGNAWLAAIDAGGRGPAQKARGKVKFFHSKNLTEWSESRVEGRYLGRRSILAMTPEGRMWAATDEGSFLERVTE
jgi:photosystem II stability/assembly factor-like uncharacterized protein